LLHDLVLHTINIVINIQVSELTAVTGFTKRLESISMNPSVVCIHRCHLQQEDARPDGRCDTRSSRIINDYMTRDSTFTLTFTCLQQVLSKFAPDSHSFMQKTYLTDSNC